MQEYLAMIGLGFWDKYVMVAKTKTCISRYLGGLGRASNIVQQLLFINVWVLIREDKNDCKSNLACKMLSRGKEIR
jgi:hypothetical protein